MCNYAEHQSPTIKLPSRFRLYSVLRLSVRKDNNASARITTRNGNELRLRQSATPRIQNNEERPKPPAARVNLACQSLLQQPQPDRRNQYSGFNDRTRQCLKSSGNLRANEAANTSRVVKDSSCHVTIASSTSSLQISNTTLANKRYKLKGHVFPFEKSSTTQYEDVDELANNASTEQRISLPPVPPLRLYRARHTFSEELKLLSKCGWYWGPLSRSEARSRLDHEPDGTFLVRDSCSSYHLLSLSYRISGQTYHTRIIYCNGYYSLFSNSDLFPSITDLIEYSLKVSEYGALCYFMPPDSNSESLAVRLLHPASRFKSLRSLQSICRFVIRQNICWEAVDKLPIPPSLVNFLQQTCA